MYTYRCTKTTRVHNVISPTGALMLWKKKMHFFDRPGNNFFHLFTLHLIGAILFQGALFPPPFACVLFPCFSLSLDVLSMPAPERHLFSC